MSKKDNLSDFLFDIAEAIRSKKGVTTLINPQKFSEEILSISGGDISGIINGTITEVTGSTLSGVETIRDNAFSGLTIENVNIPSNVSSIGANAFSNNNISTLTIDEGVTTIGTSAFENNQITTLTIPQTVTTIGASAFAGNNLTEITMESDTPPVVTDTTFPSSLQTTNVSYNGYQNYVDDENWQTYKDTLVRGLAIPSTITVTVNNYLGELVNGATVTIEGNGLTFTGTTDASGIFVQGDLQPATYTISVSDLEGFKTPIAIEIVVEEDSDNSTTITYLEKPSLNVPEFSRTFGENSIDTIVSIANAISYHNMTSDEVNTNFGWKEGDVMTYTRSDGKNIDAQIIGFNHDKLSGEDAKAGITLQTVNCVTENTTMDTVSSNSGGYPRSNMKRRVLPTELNKLPSNLRSAIKLVDKQSANGGSTNYSSIVTSEEYLFILSEREIEDVVNYAQNGEYEGTQYAYWKGKPSSEKIKKYDADGDGVYETTTHWWLRSCNKNSTSQYLIILGSNGKVVPISTTNDYPISYAFCIGSSSDYVTN